MLQEHEDGEVTERPSTKLIEFDSEYWFSTKLIEFNSEYCYKRECAGTDEASVNTILTLRGGLSVTSCLSVNEGPGVPRGAVGAG